MSEAKLNDYSQYHYEPQPNTEILQEVHEAKIKGQLGFGPENSLYYKDTLSSLGKPASEPADPKPESKHPIRVFIEKVQSMVFSKKAKETENTDEVAKQEKPAPVAAPETPFKEAVNEAVQSLNNQVGELKAEAEEEYQKTQDPLTKNIIDITTKLEGELAKTELNWKQIELLVRQLAVLLVQKMANNDGRTIEKQIEFMRQDIEKVKKTYGGFWELGLGIVSGSLSVIGGMIGVGGGFGSLGGMAKSTFDSLKGASDALNMIGQGTGAFQQIPKGKAERDRQVHQFELERDRGHKSTVESSLQGNRSAKNSQLSQLSQSMEAAFRAFTAMAQR